MFRKKFFIFPDHILDHYTGIEKIADASMDGLICRSLVMASDKNDKPPKLNPGLCGNCQHSRRIESDRGSIFFMCKLSFEDSRFVKYPRLPVLACSGYQPGAAEDPI
jgi:hypothetical protein